MTLLAVSGGLHPVTAPDGPRKKTCMPQLTLATLIDTLLEQQLRFPDETPVWVTWPDDAGQVTTRPLCDVTPIVAPDHLPGLLLSGRGLDEAGVVCAFCGEAECENTCTAALLAGRGPTGRCGEA